MDWQWVAIIVLFVLWVGSMSGDGNIIRRLDRVEREMDESRINTTSMMEEHVERVDDVITAVNRLIEAEATLDTLYAMKKDVALIRDDLEWWRTQVQTELGKPLQEVD